MSEKSGLMRYQTNQRKLTSKLSYTRDIGLRITKHAEKRDTSALVILPTSYQRQTGSSKPRNVEARNVDSESRGRSGELRNPEPDPDSVLSWDELKEYCLRLETDVVQKDDRIILTEISDDPPIV